MESNNVFYHGGGGDPGASEKTVLFVSLVPFDPHMKTTSVHFDTECTIVAAGVPSPQHKYILLCQSSCPISLVKVGTPVLFQFLTLM